MGILVTIYLAVAALVTASSFYGGALNRRPIMHFRAAHQVALGAVSVVVGAVWPLFVPALTVVAVRSLRQKPLNPVAKLLDFRATRDRVVVR